MGQSGASAHARHHGGRGQGLSKQPTAIFVAYGVDSLDLSWIPDDVEVVVVRNDRLLDAAALNHPRVRVIDMPSNVGFGAGVNAALAAVTSARVVLCNPDVDARPDHWKVLVDADPDELVTVPQSDSAGDRNWVVNRYPTARSLLLTGYRVGRLLGRHSRLRRMLEPLAGRWGRAQRAALDVRAGTWSLHERWCTGALVSVPTAALRAVGGFDPGYFLYLEDTDLCRRLANYDPGIEVRLVDIEPVTHRVGGSAPTKAALREVDRHYLASIVRYARSRPGLRWRLCVLGLAPRRWWLT